MADHYHRLVANTYRACEIYTGVALFYLVLTILSSQTFSFLEDWMNPLKRSNKTTTQLVGK
jgi:arginine/lysine/histidine/glutamine transport system substrate-binding/permease protein